MLLAVMNIPTLLQLGVVDNGAIEALGYHQVSGILDSRKLGFETGG